MLGHAPPFLCTILQDIAHRNAGNAISLMIKMNSNFRLVVDHSMDAPQSLDQARAAFFPGVNHPCVPSMLGRGVGGGMRQAASMLSGSIRMIKKNLISILLICVVFVLYGHQFLLLASITSLQYLLCHGGHGVGPEASTRGRVLCL